MYAIEFETDVQNNMLSIPPEVSLHLLPCQHVKVILLLQEAVATEIPKMFQRAQVNKIILPTRDSLHE